MTIAIASRSFENLTETFIRNHVEAFSGSRRALITADHKVGTFGDIPQFVIRPWHRRFAARLVKRMPGMHPRVSIWAPSSRLSQFGEQTLSEFLKAQGVEAVLAEFGPFGLAIYQGVARHGARFFCFFHGYDASELLGSRAYVEAIKEMSQVASALICPSQFLSQQLQMAGVEPHKLVVMPYGVKIPTRQAPRSNSRPRFLAVGRFVPKKAPLALIDAFAKVREQLPAATLDFVGGGPLREPAEHYALDLGLGGIVKFHGPLSHESVLNLYLHSSIFVQHSITTPNGDAEGLPVAILEAMASGLPVVSTQHSGIIEAVVEGETGFLVPEGDSDGMAERMLTLASQSELQRLMGKAARQRARKLYSAEATNGALRDLVLHERR